MATHQLQEMMSTNELTDPVTGLVRQSSQMEHLLLALLRARHLGKHVGVVVVDIDDFSDVLTEWGWTVADEVLAVVAERIVGALRADDATSRLAADRFTSVCEGLDGPEDGPALERRVLAGFVAPVTHAGQVIPLSISIGVATSDGSATPEHLIWEAERALHWAEPPRPSPLWSTWAGEWPGWAIAGDTGHPYGAEEAEEPAKPVGGPHTCHNPFSRARGASSSSDSA